MSKEAFIVPFPTTMCGAKMRIVSAENPQLAFVEEHRVELGYEDLFPDSIGISYPCNKDYNFMMGPPIWHDCSLLEDHGHILLQCDDGTALLPHIIRSQEDIAQVIEDLKCIDYLDDAGMSALCFILTNDPITKSLPLSSPHPKVTYSMKFAFWG